MLVPLAVCVLAGMPRPLSGFEENCGQTRTEVRYRMRGHDLDLELAEGVAVLRGARLHDARITLRLLGAAPAPLEGEGRLPGHVSYLLGNREADWVLEAPLYARVVAHGVYPGVDLTWYEGERGIEFDLHLAAGADPDAIVFAVEDAESWRIDDDGSLALLAGGGRAFLRSPRVLQDGRPVAGAWSKRSDRRVGFRLGDYDHGRALLIDPVLEFSTLLGGSAQEWARDITLDAAGNIYLLARTNSGDMPLAAPIDASANGYEDIYVAELTPDGSQLVFATYLGGWYWDYAGGIVVDGSGVIHVAGETLSRDFPVRDALQPDYRGPSTGIGDGDAFYTRLAPGGSSIRYSTFLGGTDTDGANDLALDAGGSAYLAGFTYSRDFPTTPGSLKPVGDGIDAFVARISPSGRTLEYSTYYGTASGVPNAMSVAVDSGRNAWIGGYTSQGLPLVNPVAACSSGFDLDAFVAKLDATGSRLLFSTCLGGSQDDQAWNLGLAPGGDVWLTGYTRSAGFPLHSPFQTAFAGGGKDAFVARFSAAGELLLSTYLGGAGEDEGQGVALEPDGRAWIAGTTASADFPVVWPLQGALKGNADAFLSRFDPATNRPDCSTWLGGSSLEERTFVAIGPGLEIAAAGSTYSADFPLRAALQSAITGAEDLWIAKLACGAAPGDVGNTLQAARTASDVLWRWQELPAAGGYRLFRTLAKQSLPGTQEAIVLRPDYWTPMAAEPLVFYRIAASSCCGDGPP